MKNFLHATLFALSLIFVASCSSDDPEPTHEMGTWTLENFVVTDLPSTYSNAEGIVRTIGYYGFESYSIVLNQDKTFLTSIKRPNSPTGTIEGTWELTEDKLIFTTNAGTEDETSTEFGLIRNQSNQLWYSEGIDPNGGVDFFMSDATREQLITDHGDVDGANAHLNALANSTDQADIDLLNSYFDTPTFNLVYTFIKSE
ncbi:MAG: hypothetical protein ABJF04_07695 [Reichenbachiella sp.]|uniref:DUF5004 domain-containing protein n=1 Tax=Reichenbachiella sp. TaxID=2184521 RepID=UPI003267F70D